MLELVGLLIGEYSISCCFKNGEDGVLWVFTSVYGLVCRKEMENFWDELGAIRGLWSDPWCVGGDLNLIRFSEVLEELELRDIPVQGVPSLGGVG